LNYPELIFNQKDDHIDQYFLTDTARKWQLLKPDFKNGCYVCQKHKYTIIQYDQRIDSETFEPLGNKDLIEICPWQVVEHKHRGQINTFKRMRSYEDQDTIDRIKASLI
jgi:hypothetical protein